MHSLIGICVHLLMKEQCYQYAGSFFCLARLQQQQWSYNHFYNVTAVA